MQEQECAGKTEVLFQLARGLFGQLDWGTLLASEEQIPEPALHCGMLAIIKTLKEKFVPFMSFQTFLL